VSVLLREATWYAESEVPMSPVSNIVVGLDLTTSSRGALRQASRIAARNDAALRAIHAIEPSVVVEVLAFVGLGREQSWDAMKDRAREVAQRVAGEIGAGEGGRVAALAMAVCGQVDVEVGAPLDVLTRAVNAHEADLLVLGVSSPQRTGRGPGPVATACIRHVPTNVLLAREDHVGAYSSVVACTDFSEASFRAVEMAVRIARFDKAALRVVHIATPPSADLDYSGDPLGLWPSQPIQLIESWNAYRGSLGPRLVDFVKPLSAELSTIEFKLDIAEHGHYGKGIAAYAREHSADLLVLGNQGRTDLRYALVGSTVERVLAELPCSALVIKLVHARRSEGRSGTEKESEASSGEPVAGRWMM
jgi:nucleotide-binding universal stress UspA family protein